MQGEIKYIAYLDSFTADVCIVGRVTNKRLVHMDFVLGIRKAQKPDERCSVEKASV